MFLVRDKQLSKQVSQIGTMFSKCFGYYGSTHTSSSERQYPTVIEELCPRFSLADLRKSTNNFDQNRLFVYGYPAQIYKGYLQHNDASDYTVAVRRFNSEGRKTLDRVKNEIELLCQLRHPNCVSLIGFCNEKNENIIIYEYMSNGSLCQRLQDEDTQALSWKKGKVFLNTQTVPTPLQHLLLCHLDVCYCWGVQKSGLWKKRLQICIGAARGLHYLHAGAKRTIIHRHICLANILLDDDMEPKLAGFGYSVQGPRFMSKPKPVKVDLDQIPGVLGYMAVEIFTVGTITDKSDVYSFGMVLLDVVWGGKRVKLVPEREFFEEPVEENIDPKIKGKIAPVCWQVFIDITQRCVQYEPDERPAMGEVEVELDHALSLQEQADITNTNGHYTLLSKTIIH